jgi:muramoyltetrapeptide carboxypeptidase
MSGLLHVITPSPLHSGDCIGIVSPASPYPNEEILKKGVAYFEGRGFRIKTGESIHHKRGYLAGPDNERIFDLHAMFADPDVRAIIAVRGGYGCGRLLPLVDYDHIRRNPKIFIGYSDLTALQMAIFSRAGLVTYSGPMVAADFGKDIDTETESSFWNAMLGGIYGKPLQFESPLKPLFNPVSFDGVLLGGNLSVLCSITGTPYLPDFTGSVLALEEIDEAPYRIDRMLNHLRLAGILEKVKGIVLGQFTDCVQTNDGPTLSLEEVFEDHLGDLGIPVIAGLPFGHEKKKVTLAWGRSISYDAGQNYIMTH